MKVKISCPPGIFISDECVKKNWDPVVSFQDYLKAIQLPRFLLLEELPGDSEGQSASEKFGLNKVKIDWYESCRTHLIDRLVATKAPAEQSIPINREGHGGNPRDMVSRISVWQLSFREKSFDSDQNDTLTLGVNEIPWSGNNLEASDSLALYMILGWLDTVQPVHPGHYGLRRVSLEDSWRLNTTQVAEHCTCFQVAYISTWFGMQRKTISERTINTDRFIPTESECQSIKPLERIEQHLRDLFPVRDLSFSAKNTIPHLARNFEFIKLMHNHLHGESQYLSLATDLLLKEMAEKMEVVLSSYNSKTRTD